jgi:hypothetical protein
MFDRSEPLGNVARAPASRERRTAEDDFHVVWLGRRLCNEKEMFETAFHPAARDLAPPTRTSE